MRKDDDVCVLETHFPKIVSKELSKYANEEVLSFSRYIFTRREGKQQYGYCTHCGREFESNGIKHNEKAKCPHCKSQCTVKASGLGRSRMVDQAYFVYYEKSMINPQALVARGLYAIRDYRFNYHKVETQFMPCALYVFEPGKSSFSNRWVYYSNQYSECRVGHWEACKSVFSMSNQECMQNTFSSCSRESIKKAVEGTSFRWSGWESYNYEDMVKFFDLYSKYPCVEYLTKLGFTSLVIDKLQGGRTYSAINWRGKNLFKVLKLTKQELNEIKKQNIHVTFDFLHILQTAKKESWNLSLDEISKISNEYGAYYLNQLKDFTCYGSIKRITGYLSKQICGKNTHHSVSSVDSITNTYRDYISDCKKLNLNLKDESVLFPRDLYTAHQNTIKQVKLKADKELNVKIKAMVKELKRYCFKHNGIMIRPAESTNELIDEGKALNHCVGTYADKYAKGETIILLIRRAAAPDKPYFTMELKKNKIIQTRGSKNCAPDEDVKEFIKAFTDKKLMKKQSKDKARIPA